MRTRGAGLLSHSRELHIPLCVYVTDTSQHLSSLRSSCCFLLLILHQQVDEQLKFRKTLKGAYVRSDSSPDSAPQADHLQLLEDLHFQSVDSTLTIARATVPLLSVSFAARFAKLTTRLCTPWE